MLRSLRSWAVALWQVTFHRRAMYASADLRWQPAISRPRTWTTILRSPNSAAWSVASQNGPSAKLFHSAKRCTGGRAATDDRAYRLLRAAVTGAPVESVEPARAEVVD